jgi:hypothetical protein
MARNLVSDSARHVNRASIEAKHKTKEVEMPLITRVINGPNGAIAVADVSPEQVTDQKAARRLLGRLSMALGGAEAVLRCRRGSTFMLEGEGHLYRYAVDPVLDVLPTVTVNV